VLLGGRDEAPDRITRENLARLSEQAPETYRGCRWVATSRTTA
jgi:hypothetical protein